MRALFGALGLLVVLGLAPSAAAHPWHSTFAEVELNPKTGHLEVALRVSPLQLQQALRIWKKRDIDLERTKDIDALITEYLQRTFQVKSADGEKAEIEWVGKELGIKHAWLYFEVPLPGGLIGTELSQQTFLELAEDQENVIVLRQGRAKATLRFDRKRPRLKVGTPATEARLQRTEARLQPGGGSNAGTKDDRADTTARPGVTRPRANDAGGNTTLRGSVPRSEPDDDA